MRNTVFIALLTSLAVLAVGVDAACPADMDCSRCSSIDLCRKIPQCSCCNFCRTALYATLLSVGSIHFGGFYRPSFYSCQGNRCKIDPRIVKIHQCVSLPISRGLNSFVTTAFA